MTENTMSREEVDSVALRLANEYYASLDPRTVAAEVREPVLRISELCDAGYWRREARASIAEGEPRKAGS